MFCELFGCFVSCLCVFWGVVWVFCELFVCFLGSCLGVL